MAELNYQADYNDPEQSFDVIPAGKYIAVIESSDYTENKSKMGMILKLTYQIIDGNMKGRKVFENLNLENKNQQAEQIARRSLNSICAACGIQTLGDSAELHNIPMVIDVSVKDSADYGKQNTIKKHTSVNEKSTSQPASSQQQAQTAPASTSKKPWEK